MPGLCRAIAGLLTRVDVRQEAAMPASVWIINLVVLAALLQADVGHRKITGRRLLRPLIIAAVVASYYLKGASGSGNELWLELAAVGAGIVLGLAAGALMRVSMNPDGSAYSRAGIPYPALWVEVVGARLWFAYGAHRAQPWEAICSGSSGPVLTSSAASSARPGRRTCAEC